MENKKVYKEQSEEPKEEKIEFQLNDYILDGFYEANRNKTISHNGIEYKFHEQVRLEFGKEVIYQNTRVLESVKSMKELYPEKYHTYNDLHSFLPVSLYLWREFQKNHKKDTGEYTEKENVYKKKQTDKLKLYDFNSIN